MELQDTLLRWKVGNKEIKAVVVSLYNNLHTKVQPSLFYDSEGLGRKKYMLAAIHWRDCTLYKQTYTAFGARIIE